MAGLKPCARKLTPEAMKVRQTSSPSIWGDGGTGAAPLPLMDNVGLPVKEALPMVIDILCEYKSA